MASVRGAGGRFVRGASNLRVTVDIGGVSETVGSLTATGRRVVTEARPAMVHIGEELARRVRAHASGRPGPNVNTGEYRGSIRSRVFRIADGYSAEAYTDAPQGHRLEFGFVGVDSMGRVFQQPPFPHFEPALLEMQDEAERTIGDIVR